MDEKETAVPLVPESEGKQLLDLLKKDFDRLKSQKARKSGGVEGTTLINLCFLNDEHWVNYKDRQLSLENQDRNKLYLSFNLIASRFNKWMGRMSAFNAPFKARPNKKDPQALEEAEIVDRMLIALDEKLDEPSRMRERLYWLGVGGTAYEFVPWVPNATIESKPVFDEQGELMFINTADPESPPVPESIKDAAIAAGAVNPDSWKIYEEPQIDGEVGSEILGPFNVFIDSSVRSIMDLAPDQWVHIARIKTLGWVQENFSKEDPLTGETKPPDVERMSELSLITSKINADFGEASGGTYLKDLVPMVQGAASEDDPPMVVLIESYQAASMKNPKGRYVCWVPEQTILHDSEIPYETAEIPLVDFHYSPVTTSHWTKAYITPLIGPQRFINKRISQLGEQSNATLYSQLLLGGAVDGDDILPDAPGAIKNGVSDQGLPMVQRLPPPEIPAWFLQSLEMTIKMFNDAAGSVDLMEDNSFPGQLRGPLAVPMLQEILDTQWGPLFNHLGERLARVKQMRLNRVKQFYPPVRTMQYTDRTQQDEVLTFHAEKILRSGTNFNITVERGALLPELRALRESRVRERLQGPLAILYLDERTGRLDKSKIAADLQFGDTGREDRESQYRKLSLEIIKLIWEGVPVPPVQPFYNHVVMLDELEAAMATTEFLRSSPQTQAAFAERWTAHQEFLMIEAQQQQMAMQNGMIQNAVAQATQQAAAMAAADAVTSSKAQMDAQRAQPTERFVGAAQAAQPGGGPGGSRPRPQPRKTKTTISREESE
jgi:hypothetical protein